MFDIVNHIIQKYERKVELQCSNTTNVASNESDYLLETVTDTYPKYVSPNLEKNIIQQPRTGPVRKNLNSFTNLNSTAVWREKCSLFASKTQVYRAKDTSAVVVLVLYAVGIFILTYGILHLNDCPVQRMLPVFYITMGVLFLLSRVLSIPQDIRNIFNREDEAIKSLLIPCVNLIIQLTLFGFFVATCVWIFSMNPDSKPDAASYCNQVFYENTYDGCIVVLLLMGVIITATVFRLCNITRCLK